MQRIFSILTFLMLLITAKADNFVLTYGQSSKFFVQNSESGSDIELADQLFAQDYQEVFGAALVHSARIEDARIIACTYDNATLRKFAKLRGISFEPLAGHSNAYMIKVHNNGSQLFVVGSDPRGLAFGLMSLSRTWGVSPFRWWCDIPALPLDRFELDVVYQKLVEGKVPVRNLVLNGSQRDNRYLRELLLRLRATGVVSADEAAASAPDGRFTWEHSPSLQPYLGLGIALQHPEYLRLEALRAFDHGMTREWQLSLAHQPGGELQTLLFFDMAWDVDAFRQPYAVEQLVDQHFSQMSGLTSGWSQLWNDYFDLPINLHPEQELSVESLRRGIGEIQYLTLQLSLELNNKVVKPAYGNAFFRTVEYPLNMLTSQMQRLCNMQLVRHGMATQWSVDDSQQRMALLARSLPDMVLPRWQQMMGDAVLPLPNLDYSLQQQTSEGLIPLAVGSDRPLRSEDADVLLYRSDRAIGTHVSPFEALKLPLNHQASRLHLLVSLLPVREYGKPCRCIVSVDNGEPQLLTINPALAGKDRQLCDLWFDVDPNLEHHSITFRTSTDGIYLQRVWIKDIE